jgi:hypothetical protein
MVDASIIYFRMMCGHVLSEDARERKKLLCCTTQRSIMIVWIPLLQLFNIGQS